MESKKNSYQYPSFQNIQTNLPQNYDNISNGININNYNRNENLESTSNTINETKTIHLFQSKNFGRGSGQFQSQYSESNQYLNSFENNAQQYIPIYGTNSFEPPVLPTPTLPIINDTATNHSTITTGNINSKNQFINETKANQSGDQFKSHSIHKLTKNNSFDINEFVKSLPNTVPPVISDLIRPSLKHNTTNNNNLLRSPQVQSINSKIEDNFNLFGRKSIFSSPVTFSLPKKRIEIEQKLESIGPELQPRPSLDLNRFQSQPEPQIDLFQSQPQQEADLFNSQKQTQIDLFQPKTQQQKGSFQSQTQQQINSFQYQNQLQNNLFESQPKKQIDVFQSQPQLNLLQTQSQTKIDLFQSQEQPQIDYFQFQTQQQINSLESQIQPQVDLLESQPQQNIDLFKSQEKQNLGLFQTQPQMNIIESKTEQQIDLNTYQFKPEQ